MLRVCAAVGFCKYDGTLFPQHRDEVEFSIAAVGALLAFQVMVPSAVSMAPGLIRGAVKIKSLVPQSSLPGMFILTLPWPVMVRELHTVPEVEDACRCSRPKTSTTNSH